MSKQNFSIKELENEIWKPVHEHYEVSNLGRVKYVNILDGSYKGCPYHRVSFASGVHGRNPKCMMTHTLVALAFIGKRPDGLVINHIDGNKHNNRVQNLEYITQAENHLHARNIIKWKKRTNFPVGEDVGNSKLTENQVKEIRSLHKDGCSNKSLRKLFNISKSQVSKIVNKKSWIHIK